MDVVIKNKIKKIVFFNRDLVLYKRKWFLKVNIVFEIMYDLRLMDPPFPRCIILYFLGRLKLFCRNTHAIYIKAYMW